MKLTRTFSIAFIFLCTLFACSKSQGAESASLVKPLDKLDSKPFAVSEAKPFTEVDSTVWVTAVGDMMLGRGASEVLLAQDGILNIFGSYVEVFNKSDLVLGNLEGAVSERGKALKKSFTFRFSPKILPVLKEAGFDYFLLANNHAYDYGEDAFVDTITNLKLNGLGFSQANETLANAFMPYTFTIKNQIIDVFSLGSYPQERNGFNGLRDSGLTETRPGVVWATEENINALIKNIKKVHIAIFMIHGGTEWSRSVSKEQTELYRKLASSGADLILGSHPHVLEAYEKYSEALIFYSLGNFVFPQMEDMPNALDTIVPRIGFVNGKPEIIELYPGRLKGFGVDRDLRAEALEKFLALPKP